MRLEANGKGSESITCEQCKKVIGEGKTGTHWICDDCKVECSSKEEYRS